MSNKPIKKEYEFLEGFNIIKESIIFYFFLEILNETPSIYFYKY